MTVLWSSHTLVSELVALPLTDHVKSVHEWFLKIQEKYAFLRVNFASQVSGCALKVDKGRKATQKVLTCQNLLDYWMEWTGEAGGLFQPWLVGWLWLLASLLGGTEHHCVLCQWTGAISSLQLPASQTYCPHTEATSRKGWVQIASLSRNICWTVYSRESFWVADGEISVSQQHCG